MDGEREVAGLRCGEVLERLSDFLDGELEAVEHAAVVAHLAGCDTCARFGGRMADAAATLRTALRENPSPPDDETGAVLTRLRDRLARQIAASR